VADQSRLMACDQLPCQPSRVSVLVERRDGVIDLFEDEEGNYGYDNYRGVLYSYEVDSSTEGLRVVREFYGWNSDEDRPALLSTQDAAYYRSAQWATVKRQ
jgi:hypothetical protein